jgi:hypothetical protein
MHLYDLRGMPDQQAAVGAAEPMTFLGQDLFVADEDHFNVELLRSLKGALDARGRTMVSAHGVEGNLHSRDVLTRSG